MLSQIKSLKVILIMAYNIIQFSDKIGDAFQVWAAPSTKLKSYKTKPIIFHDYAMPEINDDLSQMLMRLKLFDCCKIVVVIE